MGLLSGRVFTLYPTMGLLSCSVLPFNPPGLICCRVLNPLPLNTSYGTTFLGCFYHLTPWDYLSGRVFTPPPLTPTKGLLSCDVLTIQPLGTIFRSLLYPLSLNCSYWTSFLLRFHPLPLHPNHGTTFLWCFTIQSHGTTFWSRLLPLPLNPSRGTTFLRRFSTLLPPTWKYSPLIFYPLRQLSSFVLIS